MLNITDIQRFSIGDGDGIRTTVFFKGCNLHCPWCHNPESISKEPVTMYYPDEMKICGKLMTEEDILKEILKDKDYYIESGGGVTFSGGECMLQAKEATELARLIKQENISLFADTAGCVQYSAFEALNPFVDEYLFDVKTASEKKYKDIVGADRGLIFENLTRLLKEGKKVRIRIPLVPGFNTDDASIKNICSKLKFWGISSADLLPFHRLGVGKYEAMHLLYPYKDTEPLTHNDLERIKQEFLKYINIKIEK